MKYQVEVYIGEAAQVSMSSIQKFKQFAHESNQPGCQFNCTKTVNYAGKPAIMAEFMVEGKENARNCERYFAGLAFAVARLC